MDFIGAAKGFIEIFLSLVNQKDKKDERFDDALKAVLISVNKTKSYLRYLETNHHDFEREETLAELWGIASVKLRKIDKDLAIDCHEKSYYWANPQAEMRRKVKKLDSIHEDCMQLLLPVKEKLDSNQLLSLGLTSFSANDEFSFEKSNVKLILPSEVSSKKKSESVIEFRPIVSTNDDMVRKILLLSEIVTQIEQTHSPRTNGVASLLFLDLDNFTKVNEVFSREIGNCVLDEIKKIIRINIKEESVFDLNGDEFVLFLNEQTGDQAFKRAKIIKETIKKCSWNLLADELFVTCSIGVAELRKNEKISECILRSLHAMKLAKKNGGNKAWRAADYVWGKEEKDRKTDIQVSPKTLGKEFSYVNSHKKYYEVLEEIYWGLS